MSTKPADPLTADTAADTEADTAEAMAGEFHFHIWQRSIPFKTNNTPQVRSIEQISRCFARLSLSAEFDSGKCIHLITGLQQTLWPFWVSCCSLISSGYPPQRTFHSLAQPFHSFFIRKDILQQTTTSSGRKRSVSDDPFGQWMTNLGQGGIRTIPYEVMASVLPLLVSSTSSLSLSSVLTFFCTE